MAISRKTVERLNDECRRIPLSEERAAELPIELNQLRDAVEAARTAHDFDREPADFQRLLQVLKDG